MRDEELDIAGCPNVSDRGAAEVTKKGDVGDEEGGHEDEDQRRTPGGDLVRTDAANV